MAYIESQRAFGRNVVPIASQRQLSQSDGLQRTPPHNLDAEQQYLGALLLRNDVLQRTANVAPHHFFDPLHGAIFEVCSKLIQEGRIANPVTLKAHFDRSEPVGTLTVPQYLGKLAANAATTLNAIEYAGTIVEMARLRDIILICEDSLNAAYDVPVDFSSGEQLEEAMRRLAAVYESAAVSQSSDLEYAGEALLRDVASYVVKGVLPSKAVCILCAESTAGKTFFALHGAYCIAHGKPLLGKRTRQCAVLYVALEGQSGFSRRTMAATRFHGDPGPLFARLKTPICMGRSPAAERDTSRVIAAAKQLGGQAKADVGLIVIDTLARALAGDNENEAAAISAVMTQANRIALETGAAVLILHHPGKDSTRGMRGSSALKADADVVMRIEQEGEIRRVLLEKSKDGDDGQIGCFQLEQVVLGRDLDGDEISSCIVHETHSEMSARFAKRPVVGSTTAKALSELEELLIGDQFTLSSGHPRIPQGVQVVQKGAWRSACHAKSLSGAGTDEAEKKAFQRAVQDLEKGGWIGVYGDNVWMVRRDISASPRENKESH